MEKIWWFWNWEIVVIEKLKLYDWTFSATAEPVIGALLAIALIVSTLA